jgi:flavin-binding protein dodecin
MRACYVGSRAHTTTPRAAVSRAPRSLDVCVSHAFATNPSRAMARVLAYAPPLERPGFRRASHSPKEHHMAKKSTSSSSGVYRVTEIIGTSSVSWEDAAKTAIETAAKTLRDLRVAEVGKLDCKVENGKVVAFRARVSLSFKYEG